MCRQRHAFLSLAARAIASPLSDPRLPYGKNIAGFRFVNQIAVDIPSILLREYRLDASFNGPMIRAFTRDKLLDNGLEGRGRKKDAVCAWRLMN